MLYQFIFGGSELSRVSVSVTASPQVLPSAVPPRASGIRVVTCFIYANCNNPQVNTNIRDWCQGYYRGRKAKKHHGGCPDDGVTDMKILGCQPRAGREMYVLVLEAMVKLGWAVCRFCHN